MRGKRRRTEADVEKRKQFLEKIGNYLKEYQEKHGCAQAFVAQKLGYRADTFWRWINGDNPMPLKAIQEFCHLLNLGDEQTLELFYLAGYVISPTLSSSSPHPSLMSGNLPDDIVFDSADMTYSPQSFEQIRTRTKYLESISRTYSSVALPITYAADFSLSVIFQPLKLLRDPLTAEDRLYEERRLLLGESAHSENSQSISPQPHIQPSPEVIAEDGNDALRKSPLGRVVILGGPGAGKTTLLRYLVSQQAKEALGNTNTAVPIFVPLSDLANLDMKVEQYLSDMLQRLILDTSFAKVLLRAIDEGRAFVCLDGWDEVSLDRRRELVSLINEWLSRQGNIWIISSRFPEYESGQFNPDLVTEWELLPLDDNQRQKLAQQLFTSYKGKYSTSKKTLDPSIFVTTLETDPKLTEWGKNPLLFTLAALVFLRSGMLPTNRTELYQEVVRVLLKSREGGGRTMVLNVLAALALEMYYQGVGRTFTRIILVRLLQKINNDQYRTWDAEKMTNRIVNSGLLEVVANETYGFLHQTFQEYLAAFHVASLPLPEVQQEFDRLIERVEEPLCRQIIVEIVYLASYQRKRALEDYLYHALMAHLAHSKMEMLTAQREGRPSSRGSAIAWGIDALLADLFDHWVPRFCATLESGSADRAEDGEVASTLGDFFVQKPPRPFAVPALITSMYKYKKKARFIEALAKIGTEQAKSALLTFTSEQSAHPTDRGLFKYLAAALGEARIEEAIPFLQAIRDSDDYNRETRDNAKQALRLLDQEKGLEVSEQYQLEDILERFTVEDEEGRSSDYKRPVDMANWLLYEGAREPLVQAHLTEILLALEQALLLHQQDGAREPVAITLGELGNTRTFEVLISHLTGDDKPSYNVARKMLSALVRLAERGQADPVKRGWVLEAFSHMRLAHPALVENINEAELRIQSILERGYQAYDQAEH